MFVRCANCQTEFSLDDRQIGPDGASLRCSVCSYVFRVDAVAKEEATWRIHTVDDMQFFAPDLKTLRLWITEGRLHPDDRVSRTGKHWLRLGDMPEFSSAFAGFKGLPEVFAVSESPALDELGPPPTYAGSGPHPLDGIPEITSPPPPTGVIPIDPDKPAHGVNKSYVGALPQPAPVAYDSDDVGVPQMVPEPGAPSAPMGEALPEPEPEPEPDGAPSLLGRVTSHVQPITRRSSEPAQAAAPPAAPSSRPRTPTAPPFASPSSSGVRPTLPAEISTAQAKVPGKRGSAWPLVAGLGLLAGVAVVFGVPQIRDRVFAAAQGVVGESTDPAARPELDVARQALRTLQPAALTKADAGLAELGDDPQARALRAEIAATGVILAQIERTLGVDGVTVDKASVDPYVDVADPRAAALVALARETAVLSPPNDAEVALLAQAAALWRSPRAPVPAGVISGLEGVTERDGLGTLVLALAYLRGGDRARARQLAQGVLAEAPRQSTALALERAAVGDDEAVPGEGTGTAAVAGGTEPAAAGSDTGAAAGSSGGPDEAASTGGEGDDDGGGDDGGDDGGAPKLSIDALITRGCDKVDGGDATGGVKLLERALDRRPKDVDVLTCLGLGYAKLGSYRTSLQFYERALDRSPTIVSALRGAAKAAAKLGQTKDAVGYYERLLKVTPSDATAKAYVAEHGAKPSGGGSGTASGGGTPPQDPPAPPPPPPSG